MILLADSEGPDQTARMRSLIWAFAVRISRIHVFAWHGPYLIVPNTDYLLRGNDLLSKETTLSKLFLLPSEKRSALKGKNISPWEKIRSSWSGALFTKGMVYRKVQSQFVFKSIRSHFGRFVSTRTPQYLKAIQKIKQVETKLSPMLKMADNLPSVTIHLNSFYHS